MKHKIPSPITDENFNQVWDYANNKLVEIQKKKFIRKILALVANTLFFICASLITLNVVFHLPAEGMSHFFDTLGPIKSLVFLVDPIIHHPNLHIAVQILIYLLFLLGPAFVASSIATLLIWFTYHPARPLKETGDKTIDSKTLFDALFESHFREKKVGGISSFISLGLYVLEVLLTPALFITFITVNPNLIGGDASTATLIQMIGTLYQSVAPFVFLLIYGVYTSLNELLSTMLKPFYRTKIDANIQQDAKNYYYECNPALREEFEEEERILARAIEIKAKRRQEEADLIAKSHLYLPLIKSSHWILKNS